MPYAYTITALALMYKLFFHFKFKMVKEANKQIKWRKVNDIVVMNKCIN